MEKERRRLDFEVVLGYVNSVLGTNINMLRDQTRERDFVDNRRIASYVLYKYTDATFGYISNYLGFNGNHSLIIHYCKTLEDLKDSDIRIKEALFRIEERVLFDLYPLEKQERDLFVSNIMSIIDWEEKGTTRRNLQDYYYRGLLNRINKEKWEEITNLRLPI